MRLHIFVGALSVTMFCTTLALSQEVHASPSSSPPLSVADIEHGLKSGVSNTRMSTLVKQYGIDFELTDAVEKKLRAAGANDELLLRIARTPHSSSPTISPNGTLYDSTISSGQPGEVGISAGSTYIDSNLGLTVIPISSELANRLEIPQKGLVVQDVSPNSFAANINVSPGDIILEVNKRPMNSNDDFRNFSASLKSGEDVVFLVRERGARRQGGTIFRAGTLPTTSTQQSRSGTLGSAPSGEAATTPSSEHHVAIGVLWDKSSAQTPHDGLVLTGVLQGGPADQAGLRAGDALLTLNGKKIQTSDDFSAAMADLNPGSRATVIFRRTATDVNKPVTNQVPVRIAEGIFQTEVGIADSTKLFAAGLSAPSSQSAVQSYPELANSRAQDSNSRLSNPLPRGAFGVKTIPIDHELADEMGLAEDYGVLIIEVTPGGSADRAGLHGGHERAYLGNTPIMLGGDLIVAINGEKVANEQDFIRILDEYHAGDTVNVTLYRGKQRLDNNATLQSATTQPEDVPTSSYAQGMERASERQTGTNRVADIEAHDCVRRGVTPAPPGEHWPVVALQNACSKAISVSFCWLVDDLPNNGWACWGARIDGGKSTTYNEMDEAKMSCTEGHYPGTVSPDPSCSHFQIVWNATYQDSGQQPPRPNVPRNPNQSAR